LITEYCFTRVEFFYAIIHTFVYYPVHLRHAQCACLIDHISLALAVDDPDISGNKLVGGQIWTNRKSLDGGVSVLFVISVVFLVAVALVFSLVSDLVVEVAVVGVAVVGVAAGQVCTVGSQWFQVCTAGQVVVVVISQAV
jgi:hypothetical protein